LRHVKWTSFYHLTTLVVLQNGATLMKVSGFYHWSQRVHATTTMSIQTTGYLLVVLKEQVFKMSSMHVCSSHNSFILVVQIEELLHNTSVFGKNLTNLALVSFEIHFLHMRVVFRFLEGSTLQNSFIISF
jgi:hypothetical protein